MHSVFLHSVFAFVFFAPFQRSLLNSPISLNPAELFISLIYQTSYMCDMRLPSPKLSLVSFDQFEFLVHAGWRPFRHFSRLFPTKTEPTRPHHGGLSPQTRRCRFSAPKELRSAPVVVRTSP